MVKKVLIACLLIAVIWGGNVSGEVVITKSGIPRAAILLGKNFTSVEENAARELAKYVEGMSGAKLRIVKGTEITQMGEKNIILIGRSGTNEKIREFCDKGAVKLSPEYPGLDGFIIKTVTYKGRNYLILGGSIDRGTLYAVYHLLENTFKVGFFEDGDRVPEKKNLIVENIDIAERPYFELRSALMPGAFSRTCAFWTEEEWKQEIDWLLKKKYNLMLFPGHKWILDYARERGMRLTYYACAGRVSPEYMKSHPEIPYFTVHWPLTVTTYSYVDPRDPYFVTYATEHNKKLIENWGTDHFYNIDPWSEIPLPGKSAEEKRQLQVTYGKGLSRALVNADPQAVNIIGGWAFTFTDFWSKEDVKAYLDAIVSDVVVQDLVADRKPIYKRFKYFWGKKWLFGVSHTHGDRNNLHGDVKDLIKRVQNIVSDPKAGNCVGIQTAPEPICHNFLYFDLVSELAWNPRSITLEGFLKDYAIRRYGEESASTMVGCLKELCRSVYAQGVLSECRHYYRLPHPAVPLSAPISASLLPPLENAIRIALGERSKQGDSPFYAGDLIDITCAYLDHALNWHIAGLEAAFASGDKEGFEQEAEAVIYYLDNLEKLVSSWPTYYYSLQTQIDAASKFPRRKSEKPNDKWLRMKAVAVGDIKVEDYPACADYMHSAYFEMIKFYYRKRINFYIKTLRGKMNKGIRKVSLEELDPAYRRFFEDWANNPFAVKKGDKFPGTPVEDTAEVFKAIEKGKKQFPISLPEPLVNAISNGGFEKGTKGWSISGALTNIDCIADRENPYRGKSSLHIFSNTKDVYKFVNCSQEIVLSRGFGISLRYYLKDFSPRANINLKVEGLDSEGEKKVQALYYWGGVNLDWGNVTPIETEAKESGSFYAIRIYQDSARRKWLSLRVNPRKDVDRIHGKGTWDSLKVKRLRVILGAWVWEKENNFINGYIDEVKFEKRGRENL